MTASSFRSIIGAEPSTATPSDSTLIIIDAQNEYAEGKLKVSNAPSSRKAIAGLLQKYRDADGKIVHVKHIVPDGAPVFTPKTKLAEEYEELTPREGEKVIEKMHPSSFADTNLHDYLRGVGGKKVVLTGYMVSLLSYHEAVYWKERFLETGPLAYCFLQAHVCVSTTARDGDRLGYEVLLAEDAIGDRDIPGASGEEVTKMVMHELGDAFGTVVKSEDIK